MNNEEIIKRNRNYFNKQWTNYSFLDDFADKNFVNHLLKCTNSAPNDWKNKRVFEGGAGVGRNVIGALELGAKEMAVTELSRGGVEAIVKNTRNYIDRIKYIYDANLCNLDREEDNTYDIAFSINCIPHIPDYKLALSELVRICKPRGLVMFNVPPKRNPIIAKNDNAIRKLSTQFDSKGATLFAKIITYMANTPEISQHLSKVMELSGDELSAHDHFMLPFTQEFTQEQIKKDVEDLGCEILSINNLISVKARKK